LVFFCTGRIDLARPKHRQLALYLDEGIATLGAWARHRGFVVRDVVPYGSEPGFPPWAEKYQDRFYYRIEDLDEYFAEVPEISGSTIEEARESVAQFLDNLRNSNALWR
jgi:hypothetical protein